MSVAQEIKSEIQNILVGEPFSNNGFLKLGSRPAVDKAFSRFVAQGFIDRVTRGVFVRPKKSRFVGNVMPEIAKVVAVIAQASGETLQVHGAEAARRFRISTQMPLIPVYFTNGTSREIQVGKLKVKLMHTSSNRKLQHAGKKPGLALAALWYLGKAQMNLENMHCIREGLSDIEFETLMSTAMPAWMSQALTHYTEETL
jgi:hypothetical protein